jgi:hypothetical protein
VGVRTLVEEGHLSCVPKECINLHRQGIGFREHGRIRSMNNLLPLEKISLPTPPPCGYFKSQ